MVYLRVSTLQTVVCGVYGVSIFSYARLTSAGAIKSSNCECLNFREGTCNSYIFQCWYRRYHIDIDITIWGFEYRNAMCGCRWRLDIVTISTISIYQCTSAFDSGSLHIWYKQNGGLTLSVAHQLEMMNMFLFIFYSLKSYYFLLRNYFVWLRFGTQNAHKIHIVY